MSRTRYVTALYASGKGDVEKRMCSQNMSENMDGASSANSGAFDEQTKQDFSNLLRATPNNRRLSLSERDDVIEWLTNTMLRPTSQKEFSRRNYIKRTFVWDEGSQTLLATGKDDDGHRLVVAEESIFDVVEMVHIQNGHLGWDATWRDVKANYYGILRSDVVYLLKRCLVCADDPMKRAKSKGDNSVLV